MERKEREVHEDRKPYGEQDAWGNDIGSLRLNLRLTPLERLVKADAATKNLYALKNALKANIEAERRAKRCWWES